MTETRTPVYLDYQSTTPVDPRVVETMLPYFSQQFGNAHSAHHSFGRLAAEAVASARESVATIIGATPEEIIFTSGATEANNLALRGLAPFLKEQGKTHIISTPTEHACVLEVLESLRKDGFTVTTMGVDSGGLISLDEMASNIRPDTGLVTVMAANNEIGVIQPIEAIGALCGHHGIFFHTDAAQAVGKLAINVRRMQITLLSISGHKLYAPKGIGALYARLRPSVPIQPQILGGGQERGLRSGTLPTPLCVGLGAACRIAAQEMTSESERLRQLRDQFLTQLRLECGPIYVHGSLEHRLAGNVSVSFDGIDAEGLVMTLRDRVAISTGAACSSEKHELSHVLLALGVSEERARSAVRIGLGRFTSADDMAFAAKAISEQVRATRTALPLSVTS